MSKIINKRNTKIIIAFSILNIILFGSDFIGNREESRFFEESENVMKIQEQESNIAYVARINFNIEYEGPHQLANPEQISAIKNLNGVNSMEFINTIYFSGRNFLNHYNEELYTITTVSKPDFFFLNNGIIELVAGRTFTKNEMLNFNPNRIPIMISQQIAEDSNLEIGSITNLGFGAFPEDYDLEIIGIFETNEISVDEYSIFNIASLIIPEIFINTTMLNPVDFVINLNDEAEIEFVLEELENNKIMNAMYLLDDSVNIEKFISEANSILEPSKIIEIEPFPE